MNKVFFILVFIFFIGNTSVFSQEDSPVIIKNTILQNTEIDPLKPAKAAFYSAVIPGMGQAYNKQFWKIPLVYVALGTGIYFYSMNNRQYNDYRNAYKRRLAGDGDVDKKFEKLSNDQLIRAQKFYQRNRDLSILITAGLYILNIIDANVSAHLLHFNVGENLSLKPDIYQNPVDFKQNLGITLNYNF